MNEREKRIWGRVYAQWFTYRLANMKDVVSIMGDTPPGKFAAKEAADVADAAVNELKKLNRANVHPKKTTAR